MCPVNHSSSAYQSFVCLYQIDFAKMLADLWYTDDLGQVYSHPWDDQKTCKCVAYDLSPKNSWLLFDGKNQY